MKNKIQSKLNRAGMTLIEILIVVSLISGISVVLYRSLSNGLKVWQKSQELSVEEDIVIFFDKLSNDLRSVLSISNIGITGNAIEFGFPTMIRVFPDPNSDFVQGEFIDQIGFVYYAFDPSIGKIIRRESDYGLAVSGEFLNQQVIVSNVNNLTFVYYYYTDQGETVSDIVLGVIPAGVKVSVEINSQGQNKTIHRYIEVPIGN